VCVLLCTVFRLIVVLFCVMCVICVLCLIVVPLPPGETPFAVKYKYIIYNSLHVAPFEITRIDTFSNCVTVIQPLV
jgi:hypothetical protein